MHKKLLMMAVVMTGCLVVVGNLTAAVEAPTVDGKLFSGYDGTDVASVYDAGTGNRYVISWNDQVGPYNAFKPSDARRPTVVYKDTGTGIEVPVIAFDGVNDYLQTNAYASPIAQSNIFFLVASLNRAELNNFFSSTDMTSNKHAFGTSSIGKYYMDAGTAINSVNVAETGKFKIYIVQFDSKTVGVNSRAYMTDLTQANRLKQILLGDVGQQSLAGLKIGAYSGSNPDGSGYLSGYIAEMLVYDGGMNTAQRTEIEAYLYNKYLKPAFTLIDDFEAYTLSFDFEQNWDEAGGAWLLLNENAVFAKNAKSMDITYNNGGSPYYSAAVRTFASPQDWTVDDFAVLDVSFLGVASNVAAPLYVEISDGTNTARVTHPDTAAIQSEQWQTISIPLSDFTGVNLAGITSLSIGVGDGVNPGMAVFGDVYIDDIRLFPQRCTEQPEFDFTGDCVVDMVDFAVFAQNWLDSGLWP